MNENFEMEKISEEILEHQEQIIESLSYKADEDRYGNIYGTIAPSKDEIVDKINEIILRVNDLDSKILKIIKYLKHD